jgi:hypothetical protein
MLDASKSMKVAAVIVLVLATAMSLALGYGTADGIPSAAAAPGSPLQTAVPPCPPRPPICTSGPPPTLCPGCTPTPVPSCPPCWTRGPAPTATPGTAGPVVCRLVTDRVPAAAIAWAVANPTLVGGWDQLSNPNVPESPFNPRRRSLCLVNIGLPYHPLYNALVYKAGCP